MYYSKLVIAILLLNLFIVFTMAAQDYPYPQQPQNLTTLSADSILFTWKGASNFESYTLELSNCDYYPGPNFNSIHLEDYVLSYDKSVAQGAEVSGLTNHEKRPGSFVGVEDSGADLLFHTFNFNSTSTYPIANFQGSDFEGVTYLHNDYFAIMEERFGYVHFVQFIYNNSTLTNVTLEKTITVNDPLISGANDGFEGITYNPVTGKMYACKEYNPVTLFEFNLPNAPNFSGAPTLSKPFDINQTSWTPQDASGLYHLGLNKAFSATKAGEHLLILSKNSGAIYETDLEGNLISQLNFDLNGLLGSLVGSEFKAEGITFYNGVIWVAEDNNGQYLGFENFDYEPPYAATSNLVYNQTNITNTQIKLPTCLLQAQNSYCWKITAHTANGESVESEYFNFSTGNLNAGAACDDNNACTTNDVLDSNCNCAGTPDSDSDGDGICDAFDVCANLNDNLIGTACDDGNVNTINDVYTNTCICSGTTPINSICISINNGNDDVEEYGTNGIMYFDSSDLEFVYDGNNRGNQTVGLRFNNIPVPQGADITNAYLQFTSDETNSGLTNLSIHGEDVDNSAVFNASNQNLSARQKTAASVSWSPPNWTQVGQASANQRSTNIATIIDEIVNRQGYTAGNSITLIIEGSGERTAESFEGAPTKAPQLCINYSLVINCPTINTPCNDNNDCTINDTEDGNCNCAGNASGDTDGDGICDATDSCLNLNNNLIGSACNDGNALTTNDVYKTNCNCEGTAIICNPIDTPCNDNNNCTVNDVEDGNCNCAGSPAANCNTDICVGDVGIINIINPCNCIIILTKTNGCMDATACNYQITANCDDSSCTYPPPQNLVHQNPNQIVGGTYQAKQTIQSNINFTAVDTVYYHAEVRIELQNDFSVPVGKTFSAIIQNVNCE